MSSHLLCYGYRDSRRSYKSRVCGAFAGLTVLAWAFNVLTRYYIDSPAQAMKHRHQPVPDQDADAALDALSRAFSGLSTPESVRAFLIDLCTPAELEAMADRWKVVPLLLEGVPYREIHDRTLVSVTTIGRVARVLEHGAGGYGLAIEHLQRPKRRRA